MLTEMGRKARAAARSMGSAATEVKNRTLRDLAALLERSRDAVKQANRADIDAAAASGMGEALIDRLTLTDARLDGLSHDLRALAGLPDPVGERYDETTLPNGLRLRRQRVPLGVLGVIYESRPNVTIDVAGLAVKTGNAAILRGGKETIHSNLALVGLVREALRANALPEDAVQFIDDADRALVLGLLQSNDYVDVIIPRGGEGLHRLCRENSRIPVITGGVGICHVFVDESADMEKSLAVIHNAKTQRPSVCNALDTVLVHRAVAARALPLVVAHLVPAGVTFRAEPVALAALAGAGGDAVQPAGPGDFDTEWMSLVLGLKVVDGIDEAIAHANAHSMGHSDAILTEDAANAARWVNEVDSAAVYVNASTRFTDGGQFGLGAEVAISTQRIHARGPMGLRELTSYKWVGEGDYHVRG
ncbi:MAG: glutamate-5-semialdehyde dehydrogenase [Acidobacteriota bacterium]|jgi:glutamate-5-semialdehyde dehydrogenase|nr:glutamate-5-semialdehyde dehydrogenase [Acidobacteriota bacterium]